MKTMKKTLACVVCMALAVCLICVLAVPASATTANEKVTDAKNAVVQVQLWFSDPEHWRNEIYLSYGSGFLINDSTVVTNNHVINHVTDSEIASQWGDYLFEVTGLDYTPEEIMNHMQLRISVYRDVYVTATVRTTSSEMDYAILTLSEQLHNRTTLPIRSSSTLAQTESVYALGFPGDVDDLTDQSTYDADDVTITSGAVNKVDRMSYNVAQALPSGVTWVVPFENVECVESSAKIMGGNSGGPLVDNDGNVVGINANGSDVRNLAVASDQLIATLDALGIPYTSADEVASETEATEEVTEEVTEAVTEEVTEAATEAPTEEVTEAVTEAPTEAPVVEKEEGNSSMIILLVAGIAIVAVVVVVVVVLSKGKKKEPAPVAAASHAQAPVSHAAPANTGFTAAPVSAPIATTPMDAGETTVLSQDAGETTVLSRNVNGGTLTRKKNGEVIKINAETFVIGRERKSVNYCIADNSSISRNHVKLLVEGGITYLVDMKAANGTFVNGVKAMPNNKIALKNGDKITLADEDLEFKI